MRAPGQPAAWRPLPLLLGLLVLGTALAGCLDERAEDPRPDVAPGAEADPYEEEGRDLRTELREDDLLDAPAWEVGQWFGVHLYLLEPGFEDDAHFDLVVVDDAGDSYHLATPDEEVALQHAMYGYPGLGDVQRSDLAFNGIGARWDWMYDFPLEHGKSWTSDVERVGFAGAGGVAVVTFTVRYAAAIDTTDGERPGFQIEGRDEDGGLVVEYDFVPAVGWFAHLRFYNETGAEIVHMMSMGFGMGWTGTYYEYTSELIVDHFNLMGLILGQAEPYFTFEVADDADHVAGIISLTAFFGAQTLVFFDPAGDPHEYHAAPEPDPADPLATPFAWHWEHIELEPLAGEWQALAVGAGLVTVSWALIWQLWKGEYTL